ncbi:hypothetical protein J3Q64DRAFT_1739449 [Phycomyces blakesleeanus]|uniref:PH domain-containing protein n=1 Tax=Phycomyces blakesleeanus TaxID=4837 RepID=A0ABR3B0N6_PHYBL
MEAIERAKRFNLQSQPTPTNPTNPTKPQLTIALEPKIEPKSIPKLDIYHYDNDNDNDNSSISFSRPLLTKESFSDPDTVVYNRRPPNIRSFSTSSSIASSLLIIEETPEDNKEDGSNISISSSEPSTQSINEPEVSETSWEDTKPHVLASSSAEQNYNDSLLESPADCGTTFNTINATTASITTSTAGTTIGTLDSDPTQDLPSRASTPLTYSESVSTDRTRTYSQDILPFYDESISTSSMNLKLFPLGLYNKRSIESLSGIDESVYKGRLYIKIDAAKDLDFPVTKDSPKIRCVLNNGTKEQATAYCPMKHTIAFQQEFYIDVDVTSEFTLVLQAQEPTPSLQASRYDQSLRRLWDQAINTRTTDALQRYIRPMDRAIAQARISIKNIVSQASSSSFSASIALVNGWYRSAGSSLLGNKLKKRSSLIGQEKAVGKMEVQFFFLPDSDVEMDNLPSTMNECEEAYSIQKFHLTCWKTGSMTQFGGDAKSWQRRFYRLEGGYLIACDESSHTFVAIIDLSKVILLAVNHKIIIHASEPQQHKRSSCYTFGHYTKSSTSLLPHLLHATLEQSNKTIENGNSNNDTDTDTDKSSFQCVFGNGDKIEFSCDSQRDCERWLDVLKVIIGRVPTWPKWLKSSDSYQIPQLNTTLS